MGKFNFEKVGPVYIFWYELFDNVEKILPFSLFKSITLFSKIKSLSDKWVMSHFLLSILSLFIINTNISREIKTIIVAYAALRIFEIVIYQNNILLFHPYKAYINNKPNYRIQNPYRSIILLIHNFGEVICWFTMTTSYFGYNKSGLGYGLMENTIRIFTFSYEKVSGNQQLFQIIIFFEVICGMLLTIISLAKFIGELPHTFIEFDSRNNRSKSIVKSVIVKKRVKYPSVKHIRRYRKISK